jgi:aspartate aminotransferase
MGINNDRLGYLHAVCDSRDSAEHVRNRLRYYVRAEYLCPPQHGAKILRETLLSPTLLQEWRNEFLERVKHLDESRVKFREALEAAIPELNWEHVTNQRGMLCWSGLSKEICMHVIHNFHVYVLPTGRINISGLRPDNIEYVVLSIKQAIEDVGK